MRLLNVLDRCIGLAQGVAVAFLIFSGHWVLAVFIVVFTAADRVVSGVRLLRNEEGLAKAQESLAELKRYAERRSHRLPPQNPANFDTRSIDPPPPRPRAAR